MTFIMFIRVFLEICIGEGFGGGGGGGAKKLTPKTPSGKTCKKYMVLAYNGLKPARTHRRPFSGPKKSGGNEKKPRFF